MVPEQRMNSSQLPAPPAIVVPAGMVMGEPAKTVTPAALLKDLKLAMLAPAGRMIRAFAAVAVMLTWLGSEILAFPRLTIPATFNVVVPPRMKVPELSKPAES